MLKAKYRDTAFPVLLITLSFCMAMQADWYTGRWGGAMLALIAFAGLISMRERTDTSQERRQMLRVPLSERSLCSRRTLGVVGAAAAFILVATAMLSGNVAVRVVAAALAGGMAWTAASSGWNANRARDVLAICYSPKIFVPVLVMLVAGLSVLVLHATDVIGKGWIPFALLALALPAYGVFCSSAFLFCMTVEQFRKHRDGRARKRSGAEVGDHVPSTGADPAI